MKTKHVWTFLFLLLMFWACGKDEDPQIPKNSAPLIASHAFVAPENLPDTQVIGTLKAVDADGDELSFSISENDNDLFEITKTGALSLATGKNLDHEANARHNITVQVSDGTNVASAGITIDVIPVDPENRSPIVEPQAFSASENISDLEVIGTVEASDPEGDNLIFAMVGSSEGIFQMNEIGEISLVEGKFLDFETEQEHTINVLVGDGNTFLQVPITINVLDINPPPTADNQSFDANEDIADTDVIGTVLASDPENEVLAFSLAEDIDGLFEISEGGEISLRDGKSLDFESKMEHLVVIGVSDNVNDTVFFEVTIHVINVIESAFEDPATFITQWQVSDNQNLTIGTHMDFAYEYFIDWGDGTIQELTQQNPSHIYMAGGTYTVIIKGTFPAIRMQAAAQSNRDALVDVLKWGNNQWESMHEAFYGCNSLTGFTAMDNPDFSQVTDMSRMFMLASSFNGDIGDWNTGNISNMSEMFRGASSFNQDIGAWDTGNVIFMNSMFLQATNFDQNLGNWNISSISGLFNIFHTAGLSPTNYSATLRGWANLGNENIPDGQNMGTVVSANYCNDQETIDARGILTTDNGWLINDNGAVNCP